MREQDSVVFRRFPFECKISIQSLLPIIVQDPEQTDLRHRVGRFPVVVHQEVDHILLPRIEGAQRFGKGDTLVRAGKNISPDQRRFRLGIPQRSERIDDGDGDTWALSRTTSAPSAWWV